MINLGDSEEYTGILRMLAGVLSDKLKVEEKKEILEEEYGIKFN